MQFSKIQQEMMKTLLTDLGFKPKGIFFTFGEADSSSSIGVGIATTNHRGYVRYQFNVLLFFPSLTKLAARWEGDKYLFAPSGKAMALRLFPKSFDPAHKHWVFEETDSSEQVKLKKESIRSAVRTDLIPFLTSLDTYEKRRIFLINNYDYLTAYGIRTVPMMLHDVGETDEAMRLIEVNKRHLNDGNTYLDFAREFQRQIESGVDNFQLIAT